MRSIFASYWSLSEVIEWRCGFEPRISTEQAFNELRELCFAGHIPALGDRTLDHPRGPKPLPDDYRPFLDPPLHPGDVVEDIPACEWPDLFSRGDSQLYCTKTRLPVWRRVEIAKELLIPAWLPIIEQSEKENRSISVESASSPRQTGGLTDYQNRVAEFKKQHGRNPPLETTKAGLQGDRAWAVENKVPRSVMEGWRRGLPDKPSPGRPKNSAENSSKQ